MAWLLSRYSDACASNQYRALQPFFRWLSVEDDVPDPMASLRPPKVTGKLVPVLADAELARLERACAGRGFAERRDAAIIAVLRASGIRLSELAGIRYDPRRGDLDVWQREITVRGKGGKPRIVKISYDTARILDRYLRARARHRQGWRPHLWLGDGDRGPLTASGIYQAVARRGRQCGVDVWPHRFRHHFSHTFEMGRVASEASFDIFCERALPAVQHAAPRRDRSNDVPCTTGDLGCHRPLASSRTMMQPVRLHQMPA